MTRKRVVVAGLGDSGVLAAIHLAKHTDVVGISSKVGLVSGQELGARLSRPDDWARDYRISFDRFRGLGGVRTVHGTITGVDLPARKISVLRVDDTTLVEDYDVLIISTGVRNGFWRQPTLQTDAEVDTDLRSAHDRLAASGSIVIIGGGAASVSSAANLANRWPGKQVDLYFPGDHALPQHHPRTWRHVRSRLIELGVGVHPDHRAVVPDGFLCDQITDDPVVWTTGQTPVVADAVLWAIGRVRPNTGWLPAELLDDRGFVRVAPDLRVVGQSGVFAVGDVAATDELRTSARNRADRLVAHNVRAEIAGRSLRSYRPRQRRWGSVLGVQPDGLEIFAPTGRVFRFPAWTIERILQPLIVRWGIYRGIRRATKRATNTKTRHL